MSSPSSDVSDKGIQDLSTQLTNAPSTATISDTPSTVNGTICRGETVNVKCGSNQILRWISAKYKTDENDDRICNPNPRGTIISTKPCERDRRKFINNHLCGGCNECSFTVNDSVLKGSPCFAENTYTLNVNYSCSGKLCAFYLLLEGEYCF